MAAKKKTPAKRGASRYQAAPRKPVPGWVWLVCGLVIGGFVVMLMNLEPGGGEIKRERAEVKRNLPKTTTRGEQPKPKYDFYTLLPESEVIVPPDAMPEPPAEPKASEQKPVSPEEAAKIDTQRAEAALAGMTPPPPPLVASAGQTQYFLQAGSFRKATDADRVRAQIILLGQNVQVESGTVRDELWYRVLVGPFASKEQLAGAQKSLATSGFSNLLLQQRQKR